MQHFRSLDDIHLRDVWLTIGSFDGVHLGHRAIIADLVEGAHSTGVPAVVLTFHPHPAVVLRDRRGPYYLTSPDERAKILGELGVDIVITHPFNEQVKNLTASDFIAKLDRHLAMKQLLVGYDFALGRGRQGDIPALQEMGKTYGYRLDTVQPVILDGQVISSSQIRSALLAGDAAHAAKLLGNAYRLNGLVVSGDGRGRQLGIPTANLEIWPELLVPKPGVYACRVSLDGRSYGAVTNIGVRPTFEDQHSLRVETHLLNFSADLYGRHLSLSIIEYLREEQRFSGIQALIEQIHRDIRSARIILDE